LKYSDMGCLIKLGWGYGRHYTQNFVHCNMIEAESNISYLFQTVKVSK